MEKVIKGVLRDDVCDDCGEHQAMHTYGGKTKDTIVCCWCHIKRGGSPADWHTVCMSEYQRRKVDVR